MLNNISKTTLKQLMIDYNFNLKCLENNLIITEIKNSKDSRFFNNDMIFRLLIYKNHIIISTTKELKDVFLNLFKNSTSAWFFNYKNLKTIDNELLKFGFKISEIKEYFIPKDDSFIKSSNLRSYKALEILDFKGDDRFDEAFAFNKVTPDILGISYIENEKILGMSGVSLDSKYLYQIGINVSSKSRSKNIGTILVSNIKNEVLKLNKVPFYGTSISHLESQKVALKSGFSPEFIEITSIKKAD